MSGELFPEAVNVNRSTATMELVWRDGEKSVFRLMSLRRVCPCATCAQERGENPHPNLVEEVPVAPEKKKRSLSLPLLGDVTKFEVTSMHHVGRYALGVTWQDNHSSIFTWAFLRQAGEEGLR